MEKINNIPNEAPPVINNQDNITRCIECNLICSLKLNYKEGKPFINYECENDHKGNISLKEYINNFNKYSISKEKCNDCGKTQKEIKGDFFYCSKCQKFLCSLCQINHPYGGKHNIINYKRYDSICKLHSNTYCFYCIDCKKNICGYCQLSHKNHELINLPEFNYSEEKINKLIEEIKILENKIKNLDIIKEKVIEEINKLKESNELEMKFIKILFNCYKYEENQNNLNYNVVQNLKDFEKQFKLNGLEKYEKIYEEGNRYLLFLQKLRGNEQNDYKSNNLNHNKVKKSYNFNQKGNKANNYKSNSLKYNFKTLKYHTDRIFYLSKLKDGRLISCSCDKSINIYKKDTYELQLSIKEHSNTVRSCTQLNDERIISCSGDKTMKIIKLIGEDKYQIDQILEGHTNQVEKIIEIKENELISVSFDKNMKIWKLNNENKFNCYKTINFQNLESNCNILKLNKNEFVTSSWGDKNLKFWNLNNYTNINVMNNIESIWTRKNMCLLEDDILCIGGDNLKGFYLIKISTHQLIKNIKGPFIFTINECLDNLFLCSLVNEEGYNSLVKYKYEYPNLVKVFEKEKAHNNNIIACVELNDGIIASGGDGDNYSIKLWKD